MVHDFLPAFMLLPLLGLTSCTRPNEQAAALPSPKFDAALAFHKGEQTAVLAGGCFWGIQLVFQHVKGVLNVTSGYSGGAPDTADYQSVSNGLTGHAEAVKVVYDPSQITFGQLLRVFFSVAHDPTELNRQGPDVGTQYRSAIFATGDEQEHIAHRYIAQLNEARLLPHDIVTEVVPLKGFYPAETYHQDYAVQHPESPYIRVNDLPKVDQLRELLPQLYKGD